MRRNDRKKKNKSHLGAQAPTELSQFEIALEAQRQKHQRLSQVEVAEKITVIKAHIPGFTYDSATDRYYKISGPSSLQKNYELKSRKTANPSDLPKAENAKRITYLQLLSRRELGPIRTLGQQSNTFLYSKMTAASLMFESLHNNHGPGIVDIDCYSDTDSSYHPAFGVARTSARSICIYDSPETGGDYINLNNFTRLGGSSDPQWRPSSSENFNEKPSLAALFYSPTSDFVQPVLLQRNNGPSLNSSHRSTEGRQQSSWIVNKIGGMGSKDQGSVRRIRWDSKGENLFLMCETGIWMSNIERNMVSTSSDFNRNASGGSFDRSTMVLSTQNPNDKNKCSQAVATCNSKLDDSTIYVGHRNGDLLSVDLRAPSNITKIGCLPYCTDFIECLTDGFTLVGQDITGCVSLYDCRTSGGMNKEYRRVVNGIKDEVRKTRRFWLSPDESFIVVPTNSSLCPILENDKDNQNSNYLSGLAAISLRLPSSSNSRQSRSGNKNENLLSFSELNAPTQVYEETASRLAVVGSSVKISSSIGQSSLSSSSRKDSNNLFPGLYCVANICEGDPFDFTSKSRGSILFKAKSSRTLGQDISPQP